MAGLQATREAYRDAIAAGLPDVLVIGDPRQIVAPCVFVDLISIDGALTDCALSGNIVVYVIATPDPDAVGANQIDAIADRIFALELPGPATSAGRLLAMPNGIQLPAYAITLPVTVEIMEGIRV